MKTTYRFASLAALALLPVMPFALLGYAGQDLPFHVTSWMGVRDAWHAGQWMPAWAPGANFTLGDPHLYFYPPIALWIGGGLSLLLPLTLVPAVFAWLALLASGLTMYLAVKPFVADNDRLPAAVLYMLNPYLVITALVRFAAGELLVQACLPLILLALYRTIWQEGRLEDSLKDRREDRLKDRHEDRRATLLLGCLLGLAWLSDVPASIVLLYGLLTVSALCAWQQRSPQPVWRFLLAESIAAALAAFYLLPAWAERAWINPDGLLRTDLRESLLFMPQPNLLASSLRFAFWAFTCTATLIAAACLWKRKRIPRPAEDPATRTWIYLAATSFFFQLPLALPLWQHLPELRFAQFPFRFLLLSSAALPPLLLDRATPRTLRSPAYALTAAMTLLPFLIHASVQAVPANRRPPLASRVSTWQREGYPGSPEYVPAGAGRPLAPQHLAQAAVVNQSPASTCRIAPQPQSSLSKTLTTDADQPCQLRLALFFYPYWRASDETGRPLATARDATGLLLLTIPAGIHTVHIAFRPASPARSAGLALSLLSLLVVIGSAYSLRTSG